MVRVVSAIYTYVGDCSSLYFGYVRQDRTAETELHQDESAAEQIRSDLYSGLTDAVNSGDTKAK